MHDTATRTAKIHYPETLHQAHHIALPRHGSFAGTIYWGRAFPFLQRIRWARHGSSSSRARPSAETSFLSKAVYNSHPLSGIKQARYSSTARPSPEVYRAV
jgi:hypothetical protein